MCLLFSVISGLSWGVSFFVACVFGSLSACDGVWYLFVEFVGYEGVSARCVVHKSNVITRAEVLPVHCEGSVFYFLVDWYSVDLVIGELGEVVTAGGIFGVEFSNLAVVHLA